MSEGMTITGMLGQSGLLTLLGMCVVFGFIVILILCMKLLQVIVHAFKLDKKDSVETTSDKVTAAPVSQSTDNGAVVAAIAAAVHDRALNS